MSLTVVDENVTVLVKSELFVVELALMVTVVLLIDGEFPVDVAVDICVEKDKFSDVVMLEVGEDVSVEEFGLTFGVVVDEE